MIYDCYRERLPAGMCQIDFGFGAKDQSLIDEMKQFFNEVNNPGDAARVFNNGC